MLLPHLPMRAARGLAWAVAAALLVPARAQAADDKEVCLTAADQGQSLRDDGRYLVARDQFLACARDICPKIVHDQCTEWLRQLDEGMPTVVFGVKDQRGNDITSARVLSDGKLITTNLDGKPVPLDPGPHEIRFERGDPNESVTVHVVLRTGEKNRDVTAAFPSLDAPAPLAPGTSAVEPGASSGAPMRETTTPSTARIATSVSLLGAGVVTAGLGVYFGLQSQSEKSTGDNLVSKLNSRSACAVTPASSDCGALSSARDAQNTDAVLNEVLLIGGGVLGAGAVATWFLWPRAHDSQGAAAHWLAPTIGPGVVGLRFGGTL